MDIQLNIQVNRNTFINPKSALYDIKTVVGKHKIVKHCKEEKVFDKTKAVLEYCESIRDNYRKSKTLQ